MESDLNESRVSREMLIFEEAPVLQAIAHLAVPTIFGQIILVFYNMADTFFIGMTGSDEKLTAVTVCIPAFMFLSAISNLFGVGGASEISRALGRHNRRRARAACVFAFYGCLLATVLYSLGTWLFLDPYIDLLGGLHPEAHEMCRSYLLSTVVLGGLGASMNALLAHLVRSEGRSMQASAGIMGGGILNMLLDPLFMFVLLPPGFEVLGAGLATALANWLATAYFLLLLWLNRRRSVLSLAPAGRVPDRELAVSILSVGLPACIMTFMENVSYALLDRLLAAGGTTVQAGVGVAKKVNMLAHCTVRGMTQGVLPLIAYNYAAKNHERMWSVIRASVAIAVGMAGVWTAVSIVFARPLIGLFIQSDGPSLQYGVIFLRILCLGGPFSACAYTFISFFQAVKQSLRSFVLALLRKGIVDMPLMLILGRVIPIYGVVMATPLADVVCCVCAIVMFRGFVRQHHRLVENNEPVPEATPVNETPLPMDPGGG